VHGREGHYTTATAASRWVFQMNGGFATKPQLARQMLASAFTAGVPATWVTGDSVYGNDRRLRMWLEGQSQAYVLAVSGQESV
jgi:SRSO17 transposase